MHAADPVADPVLRKTIAAIVARRTRHLTPSEAVEVRRDLTQELRLQVLELHKHYRGDNGASFATFIHRALALHAFHVLQHYESPVSAGRNNTDRWKMRRVFARVVNPQTQPGGAHEVGPGPHSAFTSDPLDTVGAHEAPVDDTLAEASVGAHLRALAERQGERAAIEALVFEEETYETVSARTGRPVGSLRRAVREYREAVANDPGLRDLYAIR